jgi:hypothetical protein
VAEKLGLTAAQEKNNLDNCRDQLFLPPPHL